MSNTSSAAERVLPPETVLDDEGYAICPDCKDRVKCGPSGLENLRKRHMGSNICVEKQSKKSTQKKSMKDTKLSGWLVPKVARVPSTVAAPAPIRVTTTSVLVDLELFPHAKSAARSSGLSNSPSSLLAQLEAAIKTVPAFVPIAQASDVLAVFGKDPTQYLDADIPAIEVFENLNRIFHSALGWSMTVPETAKILRRGDLGLDGFLNFLKYFIEQRGVPERDFEAKILQIMDAIRFVTPELEPTPPEVDSDDVQIVAHIPARRQRTLPCEGFVFPLQSGQTFSTAYPTLMHDTYNLPWDIAVKSGVVYLTARTCAGKPRVGLKNCTPCADLEKHNMLIGILQRSVEGVHENANLMYQPPAALAKIVRQKATTIQSMRLGVLNSSRKLLTQATTMSDYKRFVVAIGSGKVQRVDRVVAACIKQKRGIRGMIEGFLRAAKGLWHPARTEEDDMFGLTILKLAGIRCAEIAHRALGLPGVTTLRNRMITPPLTASPGAPRVEEIQKNTDACFAGITDALTSKKVVHQILMFDEIATEKRIRWDPTTNHFLGVCRQHAHKVGLEFNGEADLDELFEALAKKTDAKGKEYSLVHNAAEATVAAVGIMSEDTRLYSARPILVSGDCKRESGEEHAKNVLDPIITALESKKDLTRLRTICLASDGETRRGTAFIRRTFKRKLSTTSPIYPLLKDLKMMNFMVGDDDLTADKDPKHVDKRFRNCILRLRGIRVMGIDLTPGVIRTHFQSTGHTADHIRSVFNPEDKQDVRLAFEMLKDIWLLPPSPAGTSPSVADARDALRTLGKLLFHFVSPYICVDYSLSEQLEHLSTAAHLALALFHKDGKLFMASLLYTDIMIIIKNVFFCVAKAKVNDPLGKFWLILLGTDRLEELFGILRTMIGNDANCDILQMLDRLRGTMEVSTILAKYPHWDRAPRRLRLPVITRDGTELPDRIDHIKPASVRGDMRVREVTLLTCWVRGRRHTETECPWTIAILKELESTPGIDILSPCGNKLSYEDLDADDIEDEVEAVNLTIPLHPLSTELEDAAEEELDNVDVNPTHFHRD
ncbi:hypothetical protein DFH07DRAFT_1009745 [Mycena maculata]|uniref:Uncharacterized protein n=1 Tax=Mycena maculata TaxID=230809 RepID=A0AAD7HEW5_9AGAR|nr:hypothetical protein DFH07DRAFT_1009745 [Mycena maculata]